MALTDKLTAIADAIRAKNGGTDKLTLAQMPETIANIQTGTDTGDATAEAGDVRKGKRPSFTGAALPELAVPLYEQFLQECRSRGFEPQHGRFGADMLVASENDGPVTILLDTDELLQPRRG